MFQLSRYTQHIFLLSLFSLFLFVAAIRIFADHIADPLGNELHNQIIQPDTVTTELMLDWSSIEYFYNQRNYKPVWVNRGGPDTHAIHLRQTLYVADQEGLEPDDYHLETINQLWNQKNLAELAALEIYLTDAFFRYAVDVRRGRYRPYTPNKNGQKWHIQPPAFNMVKILKQALSSQDFENSLQQLPPAHLGYQRLRTALASLQEIARTSPWPSLPAGPTLRKGTHHPHVAILRQRLLADGSLNMAMEAKDNEFDQSLSYAVQRFQVRHGLKMDGVVGPATRAALNVSINDRIKVIKLNMERWRWLPRKLGVRYIIVNTAAYNLAAIENEKILFTMWVVIGKEQRQTPVISGNMHTVVFNPYWTVPLKLVFEDLIPKQLNNPDYLKQKNIRVMRNLAKDIDVDPRKLDWQSYTQETFPYVLRQDPGPENPLGRIKFLFSNNFEIYLHDTPKRYLFDKSKRAFSAGCIRIENPLQLATFLLANRSEWQPARIRQALRAKQTFELALKQRTPVYLLYLTSWVGEDNTIYFYEDVYERDKLLLAASR
jgi:murein L,D-transpeptidase YcbB/YkuD